MLLHTRAAVLRTTGVETLCCRPDAALTVQADRECDVVVLCHSLHKERCTALAEAVHAAWPETRILLVTTDRAWGQADVEPAVDAVTPSDPDRLIVRTKQLLRRGEGAGAERRMDS